MQRYLYRPTTKRDMTFFVDDIKILEWVEEHEHSVMKLPLLNFDWWLNLTVYFILKYRRIPDSLINGLTVYRSPSILRSPVNPRPLKAVKIIFLVTYYSKILTSNQKITFVVLFQDYIWYHFGDHGCYVAEEASEIILNRTLAKFVNNCAWS